jgi:YD repeat-containing protein
MTLQQYPGDTPAWGYLGQTPGSTFSYDVMGRPTGINDCKTNNLYEGYSVCSSVVAAAAWDASGNLTSLDGDTRTYNNLGQLTRLTAGGALSGTMDLEYTYVPGQNNGRIAGSIDHVTGEQVNYTYDTLNRLTGASATNGSWGNSYTYDGSGAVSRYKLPR